VRPLIYDHASVNRGHLLLRWRDARGMAVCVQVTLDDQAGLGGRDGDQTQDHRVADQGLAPPILDDEGEQPVLDLVPLARPWRDVAHRNRQAGLVGQPL